MKLATMTLSVLILFTAAENAIAACCWSSGKITAIRHQGSRTLIRHENMVNPNDECSDIGWYTLISDGSDLFKRINTLALAGQLSDKVVKLRVSGCNNFPILQEIVLDVNDTPG